MNERIGVSELAHLVKLLEAESSEGRAVLSYPADNPVCALCFDETLGCVYVAWRTYATSAQFRFINEHIIKMLRERKAGKILADDTELRAIHLDDRRWIEQSWLPRAIEAGLKAVAVKRSAHYFGQVSADSVQSAIGGVIQLRTFDNLEDARQWLREVR